MTVKTIEMIKNWRKKRKPEKCRTEIHLVDSQLEERLKMRRATKRYWDAKKDYDAFDERKVNRWSPLTESLREGLRAQMQCHIRSEQEFFGWFYALRKIGDKFYPKGSPEVYLAKHRVKEAKRTRQMLRRLCRLAKSRGMIFPLSLYVSAHSLLKETAEEMIKEGSLPMEIVLPTPITSTPPLGDVLSAAKVDRRLKFYPQEEIDFFEGDQWSDDEIKQMIAAKGGCDFGDASGSFYIGGYVSGCVDWRSAQTSHVGTQRG